MSKTFFNLCLHNSKHTSYLPKPSTVSIVTNLKFKFSYLILAPVEMTHEKDPKKSAQLCFDKIGLDVESYRIGHTKASEIPPKL